MKRWICMDCRKSVELDKHGRCGHCTSEAVILAKETNHLSGSVSMAQEVCSTSQASA